MNQNIIGLVLKTSGYPDQVALYQYGCHGKSLTTFDYGEIRNFLDMEILKFTWLPLTKW